MTKQEFTKKMNSVKEQLIRLKGKMYTCNAINIEFGYHHNDEPLIRLLYNQTLSPGVIWETMGYFQGKELTSSQMFLRRYLHLEAFELEMLSSKKYLEIQS